MDMIKKLFNDVTGGDGKLDAQDIKNQLGDLGIDDLKDIKFPITKKGIIDILKENKASSALIMAAEQLPDTTYESLNDIKDKLPI